MNIEPLVSVIIPTKNRFAMVSRAIKSVQGQTHKNLEILVINDASTDNTADLLETMRTRDARLRIFNNAESLGGAGARNIGLKYACGDYIAFLDDDDEWLPQKTAAQLKFLMQNPTIQIVSCWHLLKIGDQLQKIEKPTRVTFSDLLWENFLGSFSFCLISRQALKTIGLLDETLPSAQDWDYWLRAAQNCKTHIIERFLVIYHRHEQARISSSYIGKAKGSEIIYRKYRAYMTNDCTMHHRKYIYYYKSLAGQTRIERIKHLIVMLPCITRRQDFLLVLHSLGCLLLPSATVEWFRKSYHRMSMRQKGVCLSNNFEYERKQ